MTVSVVTGGAQWQRLYELNLRHVFTLTHAILPVMVEQGSGCVVNP